MDIDQPPTSRAQKFTFRQGGCADNGFESSVQSQHKISAGVKLTDLALKGQARQSTNYNNSMVARQAIRGNMKSATGFGGSGDYAHTSGNDVAPWWQVKLNSESTVYGVAVYGRPGYGRRLQHVRVDLIDINQQVLLSVDHTNAYSAEGFGMLFPEAGIPLVDTVRISKVPRFLVKGDNRSLNLNCVNVFGFDCGGFDGPFNSKHQRHGHGRQALPQGAHLEARFWEGVARTGKIMYACGDVYEGEIGNSTFPHGKGVYTCVTTDNMWFSKPGVYRGLFQHGHPYGEGVFTPKKEKGKENDDDHDVATVLLYCCASQPDHAVVASKPIRICTMAGDFCTLQLLMRAIPQVFPCPNSITAPPLALASGAKDVAFKGNATQSTDFGSGMNAAMAIRQRRQSARGFGSVGSYAHTVSVV